MCRHILVGGQRCARRRDPDGGGYCWQHRGLYGNPAANEVPVVAAVTTDMLVTVLKATDVPMSYKRQFAVEFCEMFRDTIPNFDTATFMARLG